MSHSSYYSKWQHYFEWATHTSHIRAPLTLILHTRRDRRHAQIPIHTISIYNTSHKLCDTESHRSDYTRRKYGVSTKSAQNFWLNSAHHQKRNGREPKCRNPFQMSIFKMNSNEIEYLPCIGIGHITYTYMNAWTLNARRWIYTSNT